MLDYRRNTRPPRHHEARAATALSRRITAARMTNDDTGAPEWATLRWKQQVEAEARNRLRHEVHDIGASR
jgi:hypothetical protein